MTTTLPYNVMMYSQAIFLHCNQVFPSCPANAIQMGQATWAIWAAIKKYHLIAPYFCSGHHPSICVCFIFSFISINSQSFISVLFSCWSMFGFCSHHSSSHFHSFSHYSFLVIWVHYDIIWVHYDIRT